MYVLVQQLDAESWPTHPGDLSPQQTTFRKDNVFKTSPAPSLSCKEAT